MPFTGFYFILLRLRGFFHDLVLFFTHFWALRLVLLYACYFRFYGGLCYNIITSYSFLWLCHTKVSSYIRIFQLSVSFNYTHCFSALTEGFFDSATLLLPLISSFCFIALDTRVPLPHMPGFWQLSPTIIIICLPPLAPPFSTLRFSPPRGLCRLYFLPGKVHRRRDPPTLSLPILYSCQTSVFEFCSVFVL